MGASVRERDNYEKTVLINSMKNGSLDVVKYLVEKGAEVDARDESGWTPLMNAAIGGHLEVTGS